MHPSSNNKACEANTEGQYGLSIANQSTYFDCNLNTTQLMNLPYIQRSKLQFICTFYENKENLIAKSVKKYKSPFEVYEGRGHESANHI